MVLLSWERHTSAYQTALLEERHARGQAVGSLILQPCIMMAEVGRLGARPLEALPPLHLEPSLPWPQVTKLVPGRWGYPSPGA